jgi:hypothetical protein
MKMIQKTTVAIVALLAALGVARATLLTPTYSGSAVDIPDGSPVGIATSVTVSGSGGGNIIDLSVVNLTISGGFDGDLYGYLVFQPSGSGTVAMDVLLNQIGTGTGTGETVFGSTASGFTSVTLVDGATAGNIHNATGVPTGAYTPDDSGAGLNSTFEGQAADGTWTLFLADLSAGGGTSQLVSWGLSIDVVPEPITWALAGFGVLLIAARFISWRTQRKSA